MGGFPPLWSMHPCLCWIIFIPGGGKMICETHYEVPFGITWFVKRTMKSRSESHDLRNALWSPVLNQVIRDTWSNWSATKQWIILRRNGLTDSEFQKAQLIMFFGRFFYIIYSLFESPGNEIITINRPNFQCFYQIVITLNTVFVVLKTFHDIH